jgi:hypothetical protein
VNAARAGCGEALRAVGIALIPMGLIYVQDLFGEEVV